MNPIQGKNAVLSLYKDAFIPYVCATDFSISIDTPSLPTRTRTDGPWRSFTYQDIGYTINMGGVLVFDSDNFDGMEVIRNQMQFNILPFRISYEAEDGQIKSFQGLAKINSSSTQTTAGDVLKGLYVMEGSGPLAEFDGLIPCDTLITDIAITGQTADDGIVHVTYTYTGDIYQVKYRIDGIGEYAYAGVGEEIVIPGLVRGNHSIEIIPVCLNGYEGTGRSKDFQVTKGATCTSSIDSIIVDVDAFTITNTHSGAATQMKYRIDGGAWINTGIDTVISISSIAPGDHTVEEVPICSNNLEGTGLVQPFTITVQPSQSKIQWSYTPVAGVLCPFSIYVNGSLIVNETGSAFGFFMVPIGATIRTVISKSAAFSQRRLNLHIFDVTTSTDIYLHSTLVTIAHAGTETFTFTAATADTYEIDGSTTLS